MVKSLYELLKQIVKDKEDSFHWEICSSYRDIAEDPDQYLLIQVGERTELRQMGRDAIPKTGCILNYMDNDLYVPIDQRDSEHASDSDRVIPEFEPDSEKSMVIVEQVKEVRYIGEGQVELTVERYLIEVK